MNNAFLAQLLPFILPLVLVILWFLLIRPQQKRQKERNTMLQSLKKGDKVITMGIARNDHRFDGRARDSKGE